MKPAGMCTKKARKASRYRSVNRRVPGFNRSGRVGPSVQEKQGFMESFLSAFRQRAGKMLVRPQGDK